MISIHTPTKGVTPNIVSDVFDRVNFNPHSHEGSDDDLEEVLRELGHFNPHSHEGSDCAICS